MYSQSRLKLMLVFFAVFGTAGLVWSTGENQARTLTHVVGQGTDQKKSCDRACNGEYIGVDPYLSLSRRAS
jgi:hypothetical protein